MRTMKRILSAVLIFSLLAVMLTSCDLFVKPDGYIAEAEAALKDKAYTVETTIVYTSEDAAMSEAIEAFTSPVILTEVNGNDFRITMTFEKDGRENGVIYTYKDGTLYTVLDELGVTTKTSEVVTVLDQKDINDRLGQAVSIGAEDFENVKAASVSGVTMITCSDIKDEPLDALVRELSLSFSDDTVVAIKDAGLVIDIVDGLYSGMLFSCKYVITTPDAVYTLDMVYTSIFTYGDVDEIVAPIF